MSRRLLPDPDALALPGLADSACAGFLRATLRQRWRIDAADVAAIDALVERVRGDGLVTCAAVHHGNFPSLGYLAHGLATAGRRTLGVFLASTPPPETFTAVYDCGGSLARFAYLLGGLAPGPLYLQAHARWAFLGQLVAAVAPQLAVTQEIYDWMELFVPRGREAAFVAGGWASAAEIALMRTAEAAIWRGPQGFVYKGDRAPLDAAFGAPPGGPSLALVPAPPRAWQHAPVAPPAGALRLVHAGQLKGADTSRAIFGDLQLVPLIRALTAQGCEVTAYASAAPDAATYARTWADYHDEAAHNRRFQLEPRRPVRGLIDALAGQYHFGMLAYPFDDDLQVGRGHLASALASKLFTYLAAGLPVVVSAELSHMSELVRAHDCGVVVTRGELDDLGPRLAAADHARLREGVARAQAALCAESWLPGVLARLA